jgi:hypothetical protein
MYATACIPEVAARIDAYFEYRMRFGEVCKQCGKEVEVDGGGGGRGHMHEYHDGNGGEVIQK